MEPILAGMEPILAGMEPILFARCDASDTFGVAKRAVEGAGVPVAVWEALQGGPRPVASDFAGVVVFGSTYNVEHAADQPFIEEASALTREAIEAGVPYLGVCFGAQLLSWSLGGRVMKAPVREMGFEPLRPTGAVAADPLLSHFAHGDMAFQWHMDTFTLPDDATLLITGDRVTNQAYRVGDRAWGVQFHLEIDRSELQLWLHDFGAEEDLLQVWGRTDEQVLAGSDRYQADHEQRGREVFERFVRVAAEVAGEPISS
jgi:GMP synthase (glutamine-hydrolysing)